MMFNELTLLNAGIISLIVSLFAYLAFALAGQKALLRNVGFGTMALSLLCLVGSMALRSMTAQYFALSNMYESMLMLIIWLQVAFLVVDYRFKLTHLGWPAALLLLTALAYDTTLSRDIHPLQAALQSYWRSIHVPLIILSYALFTLSFVSAVVYLVQHALENRKPKNGMPLAMAGGPEPKAHPQPISPLADYQENVTQAVKMPGASVQPMSLAKALHQEGANVYDEITYRCIIFGFPLLIIGIILGGLWANEAWGNYWSWDPKESMSLATLLGYGVYLHLRINGEHSARTLSWVAVGGFALLLVTYFGVNMMGLGLHSYGKIG